MENCIFCKIANGEIPAATLYEDENFRVILDLGPASKGHALILPKSHAANIYELSDEMAAKAMILAKKMATAMTAALKCDGFNIVQNNGECAGQTVFHFHMHLIPRYVNDGQKILWTPGESTPEEMIAATERGIFVNSINAGSVNPATGEFNFNTSETFLIENGKITTPVRSATLIGTGGDILQKVDMVGNDYALGQGFCYAASGALYIGAGQPTVRVTEMTVGGDQA